jgi:hypothetical protein
MNNNTYDAKPFADLQVDLSGDEPVILQDNNAVDRQSSVSVQHYIDTGQYLPTQD